MINNDIAKRSIIAAKHTVIFKTLSQIMAIAAMVLLVRILSEHDYGVYNLLYSIISLLGMIASFGLANTLQRYIPEYYSRKEFKVANTLFRISSIIRLLSNVVVLGLGLIFWEQIAPFLKIGDYKSYFILFTVIILLHMQRGLLEICLNSYFLQKYSKGFSSVFVLIKACGYSIALWKNWDLWHILSIDLIAYVFVFAILQYIYCKKIPANEGSLEKIPKEETKRLKRYAFFYNFNDAGSSLLNANFDNFVIAMYLNPIAVGGYGFCVRISKMIERILPVNYFQEVIRPSFFSMSANVKIKQINSFYQILIKLTYIFQIPVFFFIALLGEEFIKIIFGGKFLSYAFILSGIYLFGVINSFQIPLGLVVQFKEKADIVLYSKMFAAYNLIADIILIKYWGVWGAVIATGTAILAKNLFIWYFVKKEASFAGMGRFFVKIALFWTFIASITLVLKLFIGNPVLLLITGTFIFVLSFIMHLRLSLFTEYEKNMLKKLIGNKSGLANLINI